MNGGRRDAEPRVPDTEKAGPFIEYPNGAEVTGDLSNLLFGPDEPALDALAFSPGVIPASVIGYAVDGERGLSNIESAISDRADGLDAGKLSKYDVLYAPQAPIPFGVWEYKCKTCRFYERNGAKGGHAPGCQVVGQEGDPFGGEAVHPEAWCTLWLPEEERGFFTYLTERLESNPS